MTPKMFAPVLAGLLASTAFAAEPPIPAPAPAPAVTAQPAPVQPPDELAGCWKEKGGNESLLRFAPGEVIQFQKGVQATLKLVGVKDHAISLRFDAADVALTYEIREGELTLKSATFNATYTRLKEVPPELEPGWRPPSLLAAKPPELSDDRIKDIAAELAVRMARDQQVRTGAMTPPKLAEMAKVDKDNTAYLKKLVGEVGWVGAARFGRPASLAAFLIVQHSGNVPLMASALPEIEKDVLAGNADAQAYALLFDRLQLMTGHKQRYGTQIGTNAKGEMVILPLEDRAHVDELRKKIGLMPLSAYLELFKQQNHGKEITFSED